MKVHHLNCASFCPRGGRLFGDTGRLFQTTKLVCHCLLVEADAGLVLIDTGFGTADVTHPYQRLGPGILATLPRLDINETAIRQVQDLGFAAEDVRHIVLTHLDLDHAGGLSDFPRAKVHVLADEHAAAMSVRRRDRLRYRQNLWAHAPDWQFYSAHGERWFGFECVRRLAGLPPEILLVPLRGHSLGHTAVALSLVRGWLLHAGDAYFHRGELETPPHCPRGLELLQRVFEADGAARRYNQQRLRDLTQERGSEVSVFCAHDPVEFDRHVAASRARTTNGDPRQPLRADA